MIERLSTVDLEVHRSLAVTASLCAQSAEQRAEAQRLVDRIDGEIARRLQSKAQIGQSWVTDSQDGEPMASMTQVALIAELERIRASKLPLPNYVKDAVLQTLTEKDAAAVALQATYDAYVLAHP